MAPRPDRDGGEPESGVRRSPCGFRTRAWMGCPIGTGITRPGLRVQDHRHAGRCLGQTVLAVPLHTWGERDRAFSCAYLSGVRCSAGTRLDSPCRGGSPRSGPGFGEPRTGRVRPRPGQSTRSGRGRAWDAQPGQPLRDRTGVRSWPGEHVGHVRRQGPGRPQVRPARGRARDLVGQYPKGLTRVCELHQRAVDHKPPPLPHPDAPDTGNEWVGTAGGLRFRRR